MVEMKSRDIVGKKIVKVKQSLEDTNTGVKWALKWIVLDDGSVLYFDVSEAEDNYVICAHLARDTDDARNTNKGE